jgi:UDP-N-acetylglucosamine--N-acetylmuramyl-(pentapeptide) pyrophosphoryl-undecaprenol N-acetylglucosamine transferase
VKVILAGGGTGGHIYPALAVAESLRRAGTDNQLLYNIGASGRMDDRIVGKSGIPFESVSAGQLRVRSPLAMLRGAWQLVRGTLQAWRILGRFGPDTVFATGGYASVPVGIAARLRGKSLLLYLPDINPGWAVRLLSRLAHRVVTTTERSLDDLPREKSSVVGYPVRAAFWSTERADARKRLGLPKDEKVLLVGGASQGARRINVAVRDQLEALLEQCHVLHLTGATDEAELLERREALSEDIRERYHVAGYMDEMADAMIAADLAVLRSGASVLGELPAAALAAVLVPGVYEGGYNQRANARYMEEQGAALVLENEELGRLTDVVRDLLNDDAKRTQMADSAHKMARRDAADEIARMLTNTTLQGAPA